MVNSDNEFWLTSYPDGYLHTGQFGAWNSTTSQAAYAVAAETEWDMQATVLFAATYNIRLVIKGTGHDWYARSTAPGSLVLWTHLRSNITFNDSFTPTGCGDTFPPVGAATVQTGVQFAQLYQSAQEAGVVVIGGTCDSVGVGGCWLGGCFGTWSKLYGSAASNLLQAKVVLPDGSLVTANECSHPDLFWALRGGGGGLAGVVTEFTARTHPAPQFVMLGNWNIQVGSPLGGRHWVGSFRSGFFVSAYPKGFEQTSADFEALLQPLQAFISAQPPGRFNFSSSYTYWNASAWKPAEPLPWVEVHPDREISTALVSSLGKLIPFRMMQTPAGLDQMAAAFLSISLALPENVVTLLGIDFEKGQAGASPAALELFSETALNPIFADAMGLLLVMCNAPSLPTVPISSQMLTVMWPRMQKYVVLSQGDPLWPLCEAGAAGDEAQAALCMDQWVNTRVPQLQTNFEVAREILNTNFPNLDGAGIPFSGAYMHETDYYDSEWSASQWGDINYQRLLAIKQKYDKDGLFICHHCVGSEFWSPDGNCRLNETTTM